MSFQQTIKGFLVPVFTILGLSACAELGYNPLDPNYKPPEEVEALAQSSILLDFKLSTLSDGISLVDRKYYEETKILETRRDWKGHVTDAPTASMVLLKATDDIMPPPLRDPKETRNLWKKHSWRAVEFFDLYETQNSIGYALWRRFLVGGRLCVIFQQGWGGDEAKGTSHLLTGYYCNAPGDPFSDGQAETVVQSISVWQEQ